MNFGSFDSPPHIVVLRKEQLCAGCANAAGAARGMLAAGREHWGSMARRPQGRRGTQRGWRGTQRGWRGTQHPGAPRAAGEAGCSLRDASCGMLLGRGGSGERQRGLQVRRSGDIAGTSQGGNTGGDRRGAAQGCQGVIAGWGGTGAWVCPGLGCSQGAQSIPGCGDSDTTPHRASALTSVPHRLPGGFPRVQFNPKKKNPPRDPGWFSVVKSSLILPGLLRRPPHARAHKVRGAE